MPQKKRKSAEEILGVQAPRKSAEEILGVQPPAPTPTGPAPGFLENLAIGAKQGFVDYIANPALAVSEALASLTTGNVEPAKQILELAGRGAFQLLTEPIVKDQPSASDQGQQIAAIQAEQAKRRAEIPSFQAASRVSQELEQRAATDPSLGGKITRGVAAGAVGAVPVIATGIASGGSIPAMAATAAAQSAAQPENLGLNVAAATVPIPIGRVVAPIIRRIRGARGGSIQREVGAVASSIDDVALARASRPTPEEILGISEIEAAVRQGGKIAEMRGPRVEEAMALKAGTLVAPAERAPILETLSALRKAGLLTGVKTHIKNIAGTGAFQISEEAARVPAAIADIVASALTKRRTISGPSLSAAARSGYEAATKGVREAGEIIRKGISADDLERLQLSELNSGSKVVDAYVNGVFRLMNAEDRVFRTYAFRRALEDRARSQVLTEIRQGAIPQGHYGQRVRELIDSPDEALRASAVADAEIAVFTNENLVSKALGVARDELKKTKGGRIVNFAADTVMPFTKTPTNIIARMLEYSPVGFGKAGFNAYKVAKGVAQGAFTDAEQRAFAQTFGRATIGSGLMALGWKLYDAGLMTGLYEDDPSRRTRDQAAGRIPGAILIGDTWHQLTGFAPLGNLMAIGAGLAREYWQEREDPTQTATKMLGVPLSAIGEQPLAEGAAGVLDILRGRVSPVQEAGQMAGSFVPTMVSDVGELIDPQQRQARGEGFTGQVARRLPGVRQMLPEATDALGRPLEDRATQMVDPSRTTTAREQTEPLIRELVRLDLGLSKLQRKPQEADEAYRGRVRRFGSLYEEFGLDLLVNRQYQRATDKVKKAALDSLSRRVKIRLGEEEKKGRMAGDARYRLNANAIMNEVIGSLRKGK